MRVCCLIFSGAAYSLFGLDIWIHVRLSVDVFGVCFVLHVKMVPLRPLLLVLAVLHGGGLVDARVPADVASISAKAPARNLQQQESKGSDPTATKIYQCPESFDSTPIIIEPNEVRGKDDDGNNDRFHARISLSLSDPGRLCTLVRVTHSAPETIGKLSNDLSSAKVALAPIGRSYDGRAWERVAGPYPRLQYECSAAPGEEDNMSLCQVTLPSLEYAQLQEYVLLTYDHKLSGRNTVARFLSQTTFGVRTEDLDSWPHPASDSTFAKWIHTQMYDVPATSHREFFRKRLNSRFDMARSIGMPNHPCDQYSRWRDFAFTERDYGRTVEIRRVGDQVAFALFVEGNFRTLALGSTADAVEKLLQSAATGNPQDQTNTYVDLSASNGAYDTSMMAMQTEEGDGNADGFAFTLCDIPRAMIGGELYLQPKFGSSNCIELLGGNLPIILDSSVYQDSAIMTVDLPALGETNLIKESTLGEWMMEKPLDQEACQDINLTHLSVNHPIFGVLPNGAGYLVHDPRVRLLPNTLDDPIPDGGGSLVKSGGSHNGYGALCSNVPRTFLNEHTCKLSTADSTCTNQDMGGPAFSMRLDEETVARLSGYSKRYIYLINGLRVEEGDTLPPCTPGVKSRWMRVEKPFGELCGGNDDLDLQTQTVLATLIGESKDLKSPRIKDIPFPEGSQDRCAEQDENKIGFEVLHRDGISCWRHVHKDHMNVYDFEYWTGAMHAGNVAREKRGELNPIKSAFDVYGYANLTYPWHHPMNRWNEFKNGFEFIGRLSDEIDFRDLPELLRGEAVAEGFGVGGDEDDETTTKSILVCGSEGEVANDPTITGASFIPAIGGKVDAEFSNKIFYQQRASAWTTIVLSSPDQLRQRMAWALAQLLVVSPVTMENRKNTENFLQYYDIFTKHAFGNYRDILREVSFSPIMADFLTFLDSKSAALIWESEGKRIYADENYARELMQLFTLGLVQLNDDGTPVLDEDGKTIAAYNNEDIMSYARSWTGFERYGKRSNVENFVPGANSNRIDPLRITPEWRDVFPKNTLGGGFVGDAYPLCEDLPQQMFLKKGARYRLLGSSHVPEFQKKSKPSVVGMDVKNIKLRPRNSQLFQELCQSSNPGACSFANEIILSQNIECSNDECYIETVQVVEVIKGYFYEFVRPPCVEQSFYDGGKVIRRWNGESNVCANPSLPIAGEACCPVDGSKGAIRSCVYTGEHLSFRGAARRCNDLGMRLCDFKYKEESTDLMCNECCVEGSFHWVDLPAIGGSGFSLQRRNRGGDCFVKAKIRSSDGYVAIQHDIGGSKYDHLVLPKLNSANENFFRVYWDNYFPSPDNQCGGGACDLIGEHCVCDVIVSDEAVFSSMPTKDAILDQLHIGSLDPEVYETYSSHSVEGGEDEVIVYHKKSAKGETIYNVDSIFALTDDYTGDRVFFKNVMSQVRIQGTDFTFRNPPHFLSLFNGEVRDATYETEAVLESVFRNNNTAPFLATRFIQRFGLSNPSPEFVKSVAASFRSGLYTFESPDGSEGPITFGSGQYGSLAAMLPAILLHPEMRTVVLDADPSMGSLDEPILSVMRVMRSMEYVPSPGNEIIKLLQMESRIGQMAHEPLTVFSFFLPHYHPGVGPVTAASLVSPESQLLAMSPVVSALNGLFSLTKYGLVSCGNGFGEKPIDGCSNMVEGDMKKAQGHLTYQPRTNAAAAIVDDLSTLLTAGRLSESNKEEIISAYIARENQEGKNAALRIAQQLIVASPEFRTSGVTRQVEGELRKKTASSPTCKPYKAIVFLMLQGGADSFNMLVPHSKCKSEDMYEQYKKVRQHLALDKNAILQVNSMTQQPCDKFGVHPQLPILQKLYSEDSAIFMANIGTAMPIYDNRLYGHEQMQTVCKQLDSGRNTTGTGVLGRLADVLRASNVATGAASVNYVSETLTSTTKSNQNMVISEKNIEKFAPKPSAGDSFVPSVENLNDASSWRSSVFGETWSSVLRESIDQNTVAYRALESAEVNVKFPSSSISKQLQTVARLISSRQCRGVERDVFYVSQGGYDHHYNVNRGLKKNFIELNEAMESFVEELKAQNQYDNVVVVSSSEFGRTIIPDSRGGSDHGWGGISFLFGGKVKGGRILGEYPSDLTEKSSLNLGRGRIQPTTSWDALWNGIALWFGISEEKDLDAVLPYRKFLGKSDKIYSASDLFVTSDLDEDDEECSQDELAAMCGLEDDAGSTIVQRVRRVSEKQVTGSADDTQDANDLGPLALFGIIGTAFTIFLRLRK